MQTIKIQNICKIYEVRKTQNIIRVSANVPTVATNQTRYIAYRRMDLEQFSFLTMYIRDSYKFAIWRPCTDDVTFFIYRASPEVYPGAYRATCRAERSTCVVKMLRILEIDFENVICGQIALTSKFKASSKSGIGQRLTHCSSSKLLHIQIINAHPNY